FTLAFPKQWTWTKIWSSRITWIIYLPALIFGVQVQQTYRDGGIFSDRELLRYIDAHHTVLTYAAVYGFLSAILLTVAFFRTEGATARRQLRPVLVGLWAAVLTATCGGAVPDVLYGQSLP